jgi:hypothetical protein
MRGLTGQQLLRLPVRTGGLSLGRSVELVLDLAGRSVVGVDVLCGDDVHRFLPLAAATVRDDAIEVDSALLLLDEGERHFYRERGTTLAEARTLVVERGADSLGELRDVVLGDALRIEALLVGAGEPAAVPFDDSVHVAGARRRAPVA